MAVEELDAPDVHLLEQKRKVDDAECPELVVEEDANDSNTEHEAEGDDNDNDDHDDKPENKRPVMDIVRYEKGYCPTQLLFCRTFCPAAYQY